MASQDMEWMCQLGSGPYQKFFNTYLRDAQKVDNESPRPDHRNRWAHFALMRADGQLYTSQQRTDLAVFRRIYGVSLSISEKLGKYPQLQKYLQILRRG